jgi:hypothetical protein
MGLTNDIPGAIFECTKLYYGLEGRCSTLRLLRSVFLAVVFLSAAVTVTADPTDMSDDKSPKAARGLVTLGFLIGPEFFGGDAGRVLGDRFLLAPVIGCRYTKFHLEITPALDFNHALDDSFIEESGYPHQTVQIDTWNIAATLGYTAYSSGRFRVIPFVGLGWYGIKEDFEDYDPHPDLDLAAESLGKLTAGMRIDYYAGKRKGFHRYANWFFMHVRWSRLDYDNPIYGDGYSLEIDFGHMIDIRVF